jgi:hypothetical protein
VRREGPEERDAEAAVGQCVEQTVARNDESDGDDRARWTRNTQDPSCESGGDSRHERGRERVRGAAMPKGCRIGNA